MTTEHLKSYFKIYFQVSRDEFYYDYKYDILKIKYFVLLTLPIFRTKYLIYPNGCSLLVR